MNRRDLLRSGVVLGAAMSSIAIGAKSQENTGDDDKKEPASGVLAAWFDIEKGSEEDVLEWHNRQHFPERLAVPGFQRGRRYVGIDAQSQYFILYNVDTTAILTSPAYMRRLNDPTDWTVRSVKKMINQRRVVASVLASRSIGAGGFTATARFSAAPAVSAVQLRQAARALVDAIVAHPGIVGAHVCDTDAVASSLATKESVAGDHAYVPTELFMLIEAITPQSLRSRFHDVLAESSMGNRGFVAQGSPEIFQLQIVVA